MNYLIILIIIYLIINLTSLILYHPYQYLKIMIIKVMIGIKRNYLCLEMKIKLL